MNIDVVFYPWCLTGKKLAGTICIVLDIFRATTSMLTAFSHGCRAIVPVVSCEEARAVVGMPKKPDFLLAGERKGLRIDGFDLGNSPQEFTVERVKNKTVVMTTTNGTLAVKAVESADTVLIGGFLNAHAVCARAAGYGKDIQIVCAGTDGRFSLEDALCAGLLADIFRRSGKAVLTDAANAAQLMYAGAAETLAETAEKGSHGKYLCAKGFAGDVSVALCIDAMELVPECRAGKIALP